MTVGWVFYIVTVVFATVLVLAAGAWGLGWLRTHGCRQHIRDDGPERHLGKSGTPTMGGILFVPVALLVSYCMFLALGGRNVHLPLLIAVTLCYMLIGFADDYLMLRRGKSLGLKARHKLLLQFLVAGIFLFALHLLGPLHTIRLPFALNQIAIPALLYYPFALLLIVGSSNATNLTDGLDGLLTGMSAMAAAAFTIVAVWVSRPDIALFSCAILGACLGFLFYNRHPAKIFMGDTGSLALGAAFAGIAVLGCIEPFLFFFGALFFVEALSVIIQVLVFKRTGRRIFKMSPIHHHFELSGWSETRVVRVFWAITALISVITLVGTRVGWRV